MATDNGVVTWPPSGGGSGSNASVGINGQTAPTSATEVAGINPSGNLQPLQTDASGNLLTVTTPASGSVQHVIVDSSALPTGAATQTTLSTVSTTLGSILLDMTNGTQITQVTGTVPLPTGAATAANQATEITSLQSIDSKTPALGQQVAAASQPVVLTAAQLTTLTPLTSVTVTQATGTNLHTVVDSSALPTGASTSALQTTGNTSLASIDTKTPALGQAVSASSSPVVIASDQGPLNVAMQDLFVTGAAIATSGNNALLAVAGTAANDWSNYRFAVVQIVTTATTGTYIFEGSNDNVNFQAMPVYNQAATTGTANATAITATSSSIGYTFPITFRYIRLRIGTPISGGGGTIQTFSRVSQEAWTPAVYGIGGSLSTINAVTAVTSITNALPTGTNSIGNIGSSQTAIPGIISDVASAAIITTTTTAAFTPTFGSSYMVNIPVTAVTGTTPTMSVAIQESADTGTNWYTVYTFPTITATGSYNSPTLTLTGNRVRYVQTITGTTPSFTRAINRLQSSQQTNLVPSGTVYTDRSGSTSATPSTSTTVAAANQTRRYFIIQNLSTSATIYVNFTAAASATNSLALAPMGSYVMESSSITTEQINVLSTTASAVYAAKEG